MHQLLVTLTKFFALLAIPLLIDFLFNSTVTGRGLLGSMALVFTFTAWRVIASRKREIQAEAERRLHRRALFHLNNERGETDWRELFWLLLAIGCFGFLIVSYGIALAGEPVPFPELMVETTQQLFPEVPLDGAELEQIQRMGIAIAVMAERLNSADSRMDPPTRENRAKAKRALRRAHEDVVEILVLHAGSVAAAVARQKGGAR